MKALADAEKCVDQIKSEIQPREDVEKWVPNQQQQQKQQLNQKQQQQNKTDL